MLHSIAGQADDVEITVRDNEHPPPVGSENIPPQLRNAANQFFVPNQFMQVAFIINYLSKIALIVLLISTYRKFLSSYCAGNICSFSSVWAWFNARFSWNDSVWSGTLLIKAKVFYIFLWLYK